MTSFKFPQRIHPRLHERAFVLAPLAYLAPALIHPGIEQTASELLAGVKLSGSKNMKENDPQ